jgi:hypothetical protein
MQLKDSSVTITEAHHGDCVGADAEFHGVMLRETAAEVVVHPPDNNYLRAFVDAGSRIRILQPRNYRDRNVDIVDSTDLLLACPRTLNDPGRGGTWQTMRYAEKVKKPIKVLFPDGSHN